MAIPPLRSKKQVEANKAAAKKRAEAAKARQKVGADKRALAKKRQPYKNFGLTKKTLEERYTPAEIKKLTGELQKPAKKMMSGGMTKKYRDGGSVRGVGKATKGVRACKMR